MRRIAAALLSMRTTAVLIAVLTGLLLLNVVLPQRAADAEAYAAAVASGGAARFVLETLGLGSVATSGWFVATLAVFLLNLVAVLVDRTGATLRRLRFVPPTEAQVDALLGSSALSFSTAHDPERAREVLRRAGYRTVPVGARSLWGVKHRFALAGFPIFHASFLLMFAGALLLYLTRDVVTVIGAEGAPLDSTKADLVRRAPLGAAPPIRLVIDRVDVRIEAGKPVDLAASLSVEGAGAPLVTRVNEPATVGALTILVERAGIAPVLWLVDGRGYTLDRVAVPTADFGGMPARLSLGDAGDVEAVVEPVPIGARFPERGALATAAVPLRVSLAGAKVFEGTLRPGEAVPVGDRMLRLQEIRYYAGLRLVSERGGGLLVAGFVLSFVGILLRMLWFRREIAIRWDAGVVSVAGRCEFFPARYERELEDVARLLGGKDVERHPRSAA